MNYFFKSSDIEVYPAGFRGQSYGKSKLVTEENFTSMLSMDNTKDGLYKDQRDDTESTLILKLAGYAFKFSNENFQKLLNDIAFDYKTNPLSERQPLQDYLYKVYACIRFRDIPAGNGSSSNTGPVGKVLNDIDSGASENIILDVKVGAEDYFRGLTFIVSNTDPISLTNISYSKNIGCYVKIRQATDDSHEYNNGYNSYYTPTETDPNQKYLNTYRYVNGDVYNDYAGDSDLNYKGIFDDLTGNLLKLELCGWERDQDATSSSLNIPNKVMFCWATGSGKQSEEHCEELKVEGIYHDAFNVIDKYSYKKVSAIDKFSFFTTSIGNNAFENDIDLNSINWNTPYLKSIGNSAFKGCIAINTLIIPDGVTEIGDRAFYGCTGITGSSETNILELPSSINTIGAFAFGNSGESGTSNKNYKVGKVIIHNFEDRISGKPWGTDYGKIKYESRYNQHLLIDGGIIDTVN